MLCSCFSPLGVVLLESNITKQGTGTSSDPKEFDHGQKCQLLKTCALEHFFIQRTTSRRQIHWYLRGPFFPYKIFSFFDNMFFQISEISGFGCSMCITWSSCSSLFSTRTGIRGFFSHLFCLPFWHILARSANRLSRWLKRKTKAQTYSSSRGSSFSPDPPRVRKLLGRTRFNCLRA